MKCLLDDIELGIIFLGGTVVSSLPTISTNRTLKKAYTIWSASSVKVPWFLSWGGRESVVVLGNFFLEEHDQVFSGEVSWCLHLSNGSTGRKVSMVAKSLQSCPTLCNPMDRNPPGSSAHAFLQARILEQVVMPSSRGLSDPGLNLCLFCLLHWEMGSLSPVPTGKPRNQANAAECKQFVKMGKGNMDIHCDIISVFQ